MSSLPQARRLKLSMHRSDMEHANTTHMKEDEDVYMAVVESIRLMTQIHLLWWNTSFETRAWMRSSCLLQRSIAMTSKYIDL